MKPALSNRDDRILRYVWELVFFPVGLELH